MECRLFASRLFGPNISVKFAWLPVINFRNYLHDIQSPDLLLDALWYRFYSHARQGFNLEIFKACICNLEASKVTLTVHFLQSNLQKWFPAAFIIEEHEPTVFRNLLLAVEGRAAPLTDGS